MPGDRIETVPDQRVETVRGIHASWNAHRPAEAVGFFHDDVEWDAREMGNPDFQHVYKGPEGTPEFWATWLAAWEHAEADPIWIKANDDRVVSWTRARMVGRGSGVETTLDYGWEFTFREGKIGRVRLIANEKDALGAVGSRKGTA